MKNIIKFAQKIQDKNTSNTYKVKTNSQDTAREYN